MKLLAFIVFRGYFCFFSGIFARLRWGEGGGVMGRKCLLEMANFLKFKSLKIIGEFSI